MVKFNRHTTQLTNPRTTRRITIMKFSPLARSISLGTLAVALSIPMAAQAAFIEDSKASLELRNFYMNRDFRNSNSNVAPDPRNPALKTGSQSKAEEWA